MFSTNPPKWKDKEARKRLRFAHFRADNRVAFEADHADGGRHGSDAEREAARYAHLCFVATEVKTITVEVQGVKVQGRLGLPEDGALRFPFTPQRIRGRTPPSPQNAHAHLEYTVEGHRCTAETRAHPGAAEGEWVLELPRAIHIGSDRVSARHRTPVGWTFQPQGRGPLAMVGTVSVEDLSVTGAALVFDADDALQPGERLVGELVGPGGKRIRVMAELRNVHAARDGDPEHVIGGIEFQGMGSAQTARLAAFITSIPSKGHADADPEPEAG